MALECGTLVVGAGTAGVCAAVTSARNGDHTILLEKESYPGGVAVYGLHRHICGLYAGAPAQPSDTLNAGLVREICDELKATTPWHAPVRIGTVYVLPYERPVLQRIFVDLLTATPNLDVYYETAITAVELRENKVVSATAQRHGESLKFIPHAIIDSSGDGVVLQQAGIPFRSPSADQRQSAGYTVRFEGLRDAHELLSIHVPYHVARGIAQQRLPAHVRFTSFTPGSRPDEGYLKLSIDPICTVDRDARADQDVATLHAYLKEVLPSFATAAVVERCPHVLDRDGPSLLGEYTLSEEDITHARTFPDGAVKSAWPIEVWERRRGPRYTYVPAGQYYEIPSRCLTSAYISNLICAGRTISATHRALGSTRVMGTCMALGEEAGKLAHEHR